MSDTTPISYHDVVEKVENAADQARDGATPSLDADQLIADVTTSLRATLETELAAWPDLIRSLISRGRYQELADALYTANQGPEYTGCQLAYRAR